MNKKKKRERRFDAHRIRDPVLKIFKFFFNNQNRRKKETGDVNACTLTNRHMEEEENATFLFWNSRIIMR
jgi:hypothetical protein